MAKERFGRLDILVNCAGQSSTYQTYNFHKDRECEMEGFRKCVNVSSHKILIFILNWQELYNLLMYHYEIYI